MKRGIFVPIVILCAALLGGCDGSGTSHTPIPVTRQSIESRSVRTFQDGSSVGSSSSSQGSAESSSSVVSASVSHTEEPPVEVQSTTSSSAPASVTSSQSAVSSRPESAPPFSSSVKSAERHNKHESAEYGTKHGFRHFRFFGGNFRARDFKRGKRFKRRHRARSFFGIYIRQYFQRPLQF